MRIEIILEDEEDAGQAVEEVAKKIKEGYTSGHYPAFMIYYDEIITKK